MLAELSSIDNFANGRDIQTLSKAVVGDLMKSGKPMQGSLAVTEQLVLSQIEKMIGQRNLRAGSAVSNRVLDATGGADQVSEKPQQRPAFPDAMPAAATYTAELQLASLEEKEKLSVQRDNEIDGGPDDVSHQMSVTIRDIEVTEEV